MRLSKTVSSLLLPLFAACGTDTDGPSDQCSPPDAIEPGTGLVLTSTFETSSLDAFTVGSLSCMRKNLILASGDPTLRKLDDRALIINRGTSSNVLEVMSDLTPGAQVALPGCGPHDALMLPDGRLLVTCYDDTALRTVDLAAGTSEKATDLGMFADGDGRPEMDHLLLVGDRIYVTLQLQESWVATGNGLLAVLDAHSLELVDADPASNGIQAYELPLENPYTRMTLGEDGRIFVACAGDWVTHETMGVVALDPIEGTSEVVRTGSQMGGPASGLRADANGTFHALVSVPDGWSTEEMQVLRLGEDNPEVLYSYAGFSLSGLAFDADGRVYVGNRSASEDAGLWVIDPDAGTVDGPYATGLPPLEIEIF